MLARAEREAGCLGIKGDEEADADADAEMKAAEAVNMKEYEHDREEKAVQRYVCRQSTCNAMYVCGTIRDLL